MILLLKGQVAGYTRADGTVVSSYARADQFADQRHAGQLRKNGKTPYISHPRTVRSILEDAGFYDPIVLQAALLHDTIEDTGVTYEELVAEFGKDVADVVREVTDDKSLPKQARKDEQVRHAPSLSDRAAALKIADKIANLSDIIANPPPWPRQRKRDYYNHAQSVVHAIGPRHPKLKRLFETTYLTGIDRL